jgi:hypothetical protein
MKKILILALAAGFASASPLMALDLYITGSTAFRANVFTACSKLYNGGAPTSIIYGGTATGGSGASASSNPQWTMTGQVGNTISALGSTPLTIHGLFTGSVQGCETVEQSTKLIFLDASGNAITNTPTIAFTDCSSSATPYPASGNFSEEQVCVQPFVCVKSVAGGGLNNITNVTWEQLKYAIQAGRIPLAAWTHNSADLSSYVYLVERTKDSGTRRTLFAQELDGYNQSATIYLYDNITNNIFYKPSGTVIVGSAGNNNANLNWGSGYVSGGNIATELGYSNPNNQAISYLSIADAKSITGTAWSQVIPFNGGWPTAAGSGISGNAGTNDFSPITLGVYPCWGYEVVVYPNVDPSSISSDQNLTAAQLGNQTTTGTILGVLDAQTLINGGSPLVGSLENEIVSSQPNGATAIPLAAMVSSRSSVGGTITP